MNVDTKHLRAVAEGLRRHLPNLDAAAIPTKCEVFVLCGGEARELHDNIEAALSLLDRIQALEGALRKAVRILADDDLHETSRCIDARDVLAALLPQQKEAEA